VKNWNTDVSSFKNKRGKIIWELSQLINYGFDDKQLSEKNIKLYWKELKPKLDPERARMLKYLIWGKLSLLPSKKSYWGLSPKINS